MRSTIAFVFFFTFFVALSTLGVEGQQQVEGGDTEVTRVRPLTEEEKRLPAPREKTRSIYLVNLLPVPPNRADAPTSDQDNTLTDPGRPSTHSGGPGRRPTLFLLQKVEENGRLPDGIYYRPAEGETGTPPPAFQKDLTDLQSYILARGPHQHPGRQ